MKIIFKILPGCLMVFILFTSNGHADGTNLTAAQAWAALTNFSLPTPPMAWATNTPTQADLDKFDDEQAAQAGAFADRARAFYTRFPADTNATRARMTEIMALQMAIRYGATNRVADLDTRELVALADSNAPPDLRYPIRLDVLGREFQAKAAAGADMQAEKEEAGRELVKDFPNGPMGYELLLDVTATSDLTKTRQLAQLMASSGGPKELTDVGRGLLNQADAVGKPLPVEFKAVDGRAINLTTLSNKVVLVDFWATWCSICVETMPEVQRLYDQYHTNGFEVVGINFDDNTNQVQRFVQEKKLAWPQYLGGYGADNLYGRQYGEALPYVWLADRKGIVRDIHGRIDTEAKIQKLLAE